MSTYIKIIKRSGRSVQLPEKSDRLVSSHLMPPAIDVPPPQLIVSKEAPSQAAVVDNAAVNQADLLTTKEAAKLLSITAHTLENLRCIGGGPPFVRLGKRTIRYKRAALLDYIESRTFQNSSQYNRKS